MFGCLKNLLKIGIIVLALIGFKTIGGFEWTHDMWVKYHTPKDAQAEQEKAKQVADIIISDDNFASIIIAVEEGRKIFKNIEKTIKFLQPFAEF